MIPISGFAQNSLFLVFFISFSWEPKRRRLLNVRNRSLEKSEIAYRQALSLALCLDCRENSDEQKLRTNNVCKIQDDRGCWNRDISADLGDFDTPVQSDAAIEEQAQMLKPTAEIVAVLAEISGKGQRRMRQPRRAYKKRQSLLCPRRDRIVLKTSGLFIAFTRERLRRADWKQASY